MTINTTQNERICNAFCRWTIRYLMGGEGGRGAPGNNQTKIEQGCKIEKMVNNRIAQPPPQISNSLSKNTSF